MRVGITYDLRQDYLDMGYGEEETAEFDKAETIEAIEGALRELGHTPERIGHARALVGALAAGKKWDLVFNIAEGLRGYGREALVPALLEAYEIPYTFSDSLVLALTLHKGMTKRVIRDLGIPTADFCVVETEADLARVRLPYPLFAKPVAEGTGKGIDDRSRIDDAADLRRVCTRLLAEFRQPVLVETYLSGREYTVGIVGTGPAARSLGVLEVVFNDAGDEKVYSYENKENWRQVLHYIVVEDPALARRVSEVALASWRGLGCRDGGRVDIREAADRTPCFIEVNPLAGINPDHSDLPILCSKVGVSYLQLIGEIVDSALLRVRGSR